MLKTNTIFIGKLYLHLEEVDSTNRYLQLLLSKSTPIDGFVVWADKQLAGRGQLGSSWYSSEFLNLTTSIVLLPKWLNVKEQFILSKAVALAMVDLLIAYGIPKTEIRIKWPNDIYVKNQKIAGILIENTLKGHYIENSIVGIGLNINQTDFKENGLHASSLSLLLEQNFSISDVLAHLCLFLERRYIQLKNKDKQNLIHEQYLEFLYQYKIEKTYKLAANNELVLGTIVGISPEGKLMLKIKENIQFFGLKELIFI